jgi:lysophospholipid acyltransferase (LPLAT)-like uncharacterized protein
VSQLLIKTLRIRYEIHPSVNTKQQYAYGFWHDKQFATITLLSQFGIEKRAGLVSASRDGDMLADWIKRLGYRVVRGSSSKKALSSLVNLIAAAKEGYSFGIAADGPRGPQFVAKSGLSFLAYKAGLQIIPLGVAYSSKWQFNSWDRYQLPKPFAKTVVYVGEPITITQSDQIEVVTQKIEQALNEADRKAQVILN